MSSSNKIIDTSEFYDLEILIGEDPDIATFRLHSFLLKTRSSYFNTELSKDGLKIENGIIKFQKQNISVEIFHIIVKYIYGNIFKFSNNIKTNLDLLITADELCLTDLCSLIEAELLRNTELLKRNFVALSHVVSKFDHFGELLQFYKNSLQEEPSLIFKASDFTSIKQEILIDYLGFIKNILKPMEVWNKLIEWAIARNDRLPPDTTMWTSDDIRIFGNIIQPFIPHINFKEICPSDFSQNIKPFKRIFSKDFYIELLEYYSFDDQVIPKFKMEIDSKIINSEQAFLLANLIKILENSSVYASISKRVDIFFYKFTLLVRGSRDGFQTSTFHSCCDMKGPTITVARVQGTNEILGGFNPYNWHSESTEIKDDSYRADSVDKSRRSFIFSLDKNNLENSIYSKVKSGECAHYNDEDFGPNFGGKNADLNLLCSSINEGKCVKKHYEARIREASNFFQIDEYEVFQVKGFNFEN